jgi:putative transposase
MDKIESLNHTKWDCKYHVVFIPKKRRKVLYGELLIAIPPKHPVSQVVGYIKGKSAIQLARVYSEKKRNFTGQSFWARGYFVSTVGRDEELIRNYIRHQEVEDERLEQLGLWR